MATPVALPASPGPSTILLVEDDAALCRVAGRMLRSFGYVVVEAPDAGAARALLRATAQPIDLLLTDLHLPDMLGTKLAAIARGLRPGLPVIFVSGSAGDGRGNSLLVGSGETLLGKPFSLGELREAVWRAVGGGDGATPHS